MTAIRTRLAAVVATTAVAGLPAAGAAEYTVMPRMQTVHVGYFSATLEPLLTVHSGHIVTIESVRGPDPADVDASGVVPPNAVSRTHPHHSPGSDGPRPRAAHPDRAGLRQRGDAGGRARGSHPRHRFRGALRLQCPASLHRRAA